MPENTVPGKLHGIPASHRFYGMRYRRPGPTGNLLAESRDVSPALPVGTVTFLFTDIVGSVSLWEQHPLGMKEAVARHHAILRQAVESNGGVLYKVIGDAIQAAFSLATQALASALTAQRGLLAEAWAETGPLRVRIGLHTGPAELAAHPTEGGLDYAISHTLNRTARVMSAAHGGQILLSQETADLARNELPNRVTLQDLGEHRLKGLARLERLFQVVANDLPHDFPPLITEARPEHSLLLQTKFSIPASRPDFTPRPRLVDQLNSAVARRLVLISSPAGFGKTTLLLEWIRQSNTDVAWFSLDPADNDPRRFWAHVIGALQTVEPGIGKTLLAALQSSQPPTPDLVASALLNDINGSRPFVLVLEDYHWIQSKEIHEGLNTLLDHLPVHAHLVITTRENPPLRLPLRRARGELAELRTTDLRFTGDETRQFFARAAGIGLSEEDIDALHNRTEGWIAGLQMAGISLQEIGLAGWHDFVKSFTGDDRYIVDYLAEEVLQRQPEEVQNFLLRTSFLDRLCSPLCDALTGAENSQEILERLERANLFILPLDNRRGWFRYHSLFANFLQQRFIRMASRDEAARLRRQASQWYEKAGMIEEAVSLAISANDFEYAAGMIERHVVETFYSSETVRVYSWLKTLPDNILRRYPLLSATYATTSALYSSLSPGSLEIADRLLRNAEETLEKQASTSASQPGLNLAAYAVANYRAYLARFQGAESQQVIAMTQKALDMLPEETLMFRSALHFNLGAAYWTQDNLVEALRAFEQAQQVGIMSGDLFNGLGAVHLQERLLSQLGRLREAMALCREAYRSTIEPSERQGTLLPIAGVLCISIGGLLLEWNELDEADQQLTKGQELMALTLFPSARLLGYTTTARLLQARGDFAGALDQLTQAEQARLRPASILQAMRARLWLAQGGTNPAFLGNAFHWAENCGLDLEDHKREFFERATLARVLIAKCRVGSADLQPVMVALDRLLGFARQEGWTGRAVEILILHALACQAGQQYAQAHSALKEAMVFAEPEGYMRIFLEEGGWMEQLLQQMASRHSSWDYIHRLLSAFSAELPRAGVHLEGKLAAFARLRSPASPLVEPLSNREIEVLQLIAQGASNPEIASTLFITMNTVKKHINNLFGKLGVTSRTLAVRRGYELGYLTHP